MAVEQQPVASGKNKQLKINHRNRSQFRRMCEYVMVACDVVAKSSVFHHLNAVIHNFRVVSHVAVHDLFVAA